MDGVSHKADVEHLLAAAEDPGGSGAMITASAVRQMVFRPPPGMEGWECFRIEYAHDFAGLDVLVEGTVWIPPGTTMDQVEGLEQFLSQAQ